MARRQIPEPERAKLTCSRAEAQEKLTTQISRGQEIADRAAAIGDPGGFESVRKDYFTWGEYNTRLLRQIYTTDELRREYSGVVFGILGGTRPSLADQIRGLQTDIADKIRSLESIRNQIELLEEPDSRPAREPAQTSRMSPKPVTAVLQMTDLHPAIRAAAEVLYADGHFDQAVFEAFKALETLVREKSGLADRNGQDLMLLALDSSKPRLLVGNLSTQAGRDRQEGIRFICGGAMRGIRNVGGHGSLELTDVEAFEHLSLASLLMRAIENADVLSTGE